MAQGDKRLVLNLRERITSADFNRLQSIAAAEKAGLLRALYDDVLGDWYTKGGLQTPVTSSANRATGDVYGGLMVQPDNASYYLVTPGVAGILEPSGLGFDDNPYRVVVDPGVTTAGVLPFTANTSGQSRWDVVECAPVDRMLTQETRSIFNPSTGIASPVLVDKERAGQLTYYVRTGTPGAGIPVDIAAGNGRLPLAVVHVPNGSTSLLTSDVYDVRPLVRDRVRPSPVSAGTGNGYAPIQGAEYRVTNIGYNQFAGVAESEFNGYLAGGVLERSTPSTLAQFGSTAAGGGRATGVNIDLAENMNTSLVYATDNVISLVAVFPNNLPRFQRYSQVAIGSGRIPTGPRGMLVVTKAAPSANGIFYNLPIPNAVFGVGATANGCLLAQTSYGTGRPRRVNAQGGIHQLEDSPRLQATTSGGSSFSFDLDPNGNLYWPSSANRVFLRFDLNTNNTSSTNLKTVVVTLTDLISTEDLTELLRFTAYMGTSSSENLGFCCWVNLPSRANPNNDAYTSSLRIKVTFPANTHTAASSFMRCLAWSSAR